jgi:hypothetical protein
MRKQDLFIPVIGLVLVACGAASPSATQPTVEQPASASQPTQAPAPELPTAGPTNTSAPQIATPRATPADPAESQPDQPADELVQAASRGLARHLGVDEGSLTLQGAVPQQWPDGSLGCPEPGAVYLQVITPGFVLTFTGNGGTYTVHAGEGKEQIVLCDNNSPINLAGNTEDAGQVPADIQPTVGAGQPALVPTPMPAEGSTAPFDEDSKKMVDMAQQALAQQLGVQSADVKLVNITPTEWSDSSLGCPQPGMNYLQVITPGYQITLEAQGQRYEYHADQRGRVVHCDRSRP